LSSAFTVSHSGIAAARLTSEHGILDLILSSGKYSGRQRVADCRVQSIRQGTTFVAPIEGVNNENDDSNVDHGCDDGHRIDGYADQRAGGPRHSRSASQRTPAYSTCPYSAGRDIQRAETRRISGDQQDIRKLERAYKSDSSLTAAESRDLQQEQNHRLMSWEYSYRYSSWCQSLLLISLISKTKYIPGFHKSS
jgi:hypothetical protein